MKYGALAHWHWSAGDVSYSHRCTTGSMLTTVALPGTLAKAMTIPGSPLLVLQGGGKEPLYSPNKAVIFHDGTGSPVAELEFGYVNDDSVRS